MLLSNFLRLNNETPQAQMIIRELMYRYNEPHRFYHNLNHLELGLIDWVQVVGLEDENFPFEDFMAWAYHDVIYDPMSNTNEADSASYFMVDSKNLGIDLQIADSIANKILDTTHAGSTQTLITDIDLAILGKDDKTYAAYAKAIRQEYPKLDDATFNEGRTIVLKKLLNRPWIYNVGKFREKFEAHARTNMRCEIALFSEPMTIW